MDLRVECKWEAKHPTPDEVLKCVEQQGADEATCKECPYLRREVKKLTMGGRL